MRDKGAESCGCGDGPILSMTCLTEKGHLFAVSENAKLCSTPRKRSERGRNDFCRLVDKSKMEVNRTDKLPFLLKTTRPR